MDTTELQSYIDKIQEIQEAVNEIFANSPEDQQGLDIGQYEEFANALEGVEDSQAAILLSTQGLTNAQIQQTLSAKGLSTELQYQAMVEAGLLGTKQKLSNVELQSILTSQLGSETKAKEIMTSMGLSVAIEGEEAQTVKLTAKKLKQAVADGILTKEEAQLLAMTTGVTIAQNTQITSTMPKWIAMMKAMALATWGQVKATAVWLATNPAGWATLAIGAVVALGVGVASINKIIDEHREKLIETGEAAREEISQIKSELDSMESSVDNAGKTFAKLIDGVDTFNNTNISLSDEEYKDFIASSNELAELFPQLITGLDDEGNYILDLGNDAEEATSKLNELIEVQRKLVAEETQEKLVDVFKGIHEETRSLDEDIDKLKEEKGYLESFLITDLQNSGIGQNISLHDKYLENVNTEALMKDVANIINDALGTNLEAEFNEMTREWFINTLDMTEKQYKQAINALNLNSDLLTNKYTQFIDNSIADIEDKMNTSYKRELSSIFTALSDDDVYTGLSGVNKKFVDTLISNLDYSEYRDVIKKEYDGDIIDFILSDDFIDWSKIESNRVEINEVYTKLLEIDPNASLAENTKIIQQYIDELAELLEIDADKLKVMLGYEFIDEDIAKIERAKRMVTGDTVVVNNQDDAKRRQNQLVIEEAIEQLNDEDLSLLLSVGIPEWEKIDTEAEFNAYMDKLRANAKVDIEVNTPTITSTVDVIHTKLKPAMDSLANAYSKMFTDNGFTHDDITTSEFTGIKEALDAMKESGLEIDYDEYENFVKVLSDVDSTSDDVHDAFDSMATMMVNASGVVNITEENFDLLKQQLEKLGVTNAEEVLNNIKSAQQEIIDAGYDLENMTNDDAAAFINLSKATDNAKNYLISYRLNKQLAEHPLNTLEDIKALEDLCGALNITGKLYKEVAYLKNLEMSTGIPPEMKDKLISDAQQRIQDALEEEYTVDFGFTYDGSKDENDNASKSAEKAASDLLDKLLALYEAELNNGLITFDEFVQKSKDTIEQFYKEGKIKAEDYWNYIHNLYEKQISYMDKVISAVTSKIDDEISDLEKKKESIEEIYNKQIESIQEEIDILEKANQKRKDAIDLQKALYALRRAENQRTNLVYNMPNSTEM